MENPNLEPLTPEQMIEYIEIFHLECNKTAEQIMAGEEYSLTATEETADLLFRINFFTNGLHGELFEHSVRPIGSYYPLNYASKEFKEIYINALNAKIKYTGYLTVHWEIDYAFLRVEHVEFYPAEMYWFYKNIPEEILRRVYIEVDAGMPLMQYIDFMESYSLGWDKGPWIEYDGTGSIIKREDFALIEGETRAFLRQKYITDERIAYLSELFWEDPKYHKEKEMMQEYGFSEEIPLTFEWIIAHPQEAYALVTTTWREYSAFGVRHRLVPDSFLEKHDIPIFPPEVD